jgi:hypothetical protein
MGKGSSPRPFSVSQEEFGDKFDAIFGKKKAKPCGCYDCLSQETNEHGWPKTTGMMVLCPICGNKRCPRATNHANRCTNSNEPGQEGSRY